MLPAHGQDEQELSPATAGSAKPRGSCAR